MEDNANAGTTATGGDGGGGEDTSNEDVSQSQNFTPVLKKRLPQPICCSALCPSMDLIALGLGTKEKSPEKTGGSNGDDNPADNTLEPGSGSDAMSLFVVVPISTATTIVVYRTISWQKMFTILPSDLAAVEIPKGEDDRNEDGDDDDDDINENKKDSETTDAGDDNGDDNNNADANVGILGATCVTWSPDGRTLVVALNNGCTLLYDIESCASPGVPPTPIHVIPAPPSVSIPVNADVTARNGSVSVNGVNNDDDSSSSGAEVETDAEDGIVNTTTASFSGKKEGVTIGGRVTRSMTSARRKRLMRMVGQTPRHKPTISTPATTTTAAAKTTSSSATKPPSTAPAPASSSSSLSSSSKSQSKVITCMAWQRIRLPHAPHYKDHKYYLDRSTFLLPKCHYTMENDESISMAQSHTAVVHGAYGADPTQNHDGAEDIHHRPLGTTELSILVVLTESALHLYLHGRYRLISLAHSHLSTTSTESANIKNREDLMEASDMLTKSILHEIGCTSEFHIMTCSRENGSSTMTSISSIPKVVLYNNHYLIAHRYNLQFVSYSYSSITRCLEMMKLGITEGYGAWSTSLRQLDTKFDQLSTLLIKYGVIQQPQEGINVSASGDTNGNQMRLELLNYILGGKSSRNADSSNAMDQFFTHPLMNDQLLTRLFRTLEANVAGLEVLLRKKVLSPVRSLIYDTGELYGMVKTMNAESTYSGDTSEDGVDELPALMDNDTCLRLCQVSEILFIVAEQCVSQVVEIRHRLDCLTKWIRGTASQVKAKGTPMNSVQRENARKRRVPEYITRKVADFVSAPLKSDSSELGKKRGSTEMIMGILLSDYFEKDRVFIEKPRGTLSDVDFNKSDGFRHFAETPSLKAALAVTTDICLELFDEPREVMTKSMEMIQVVPEECASHSQSVIATHSRFCSKFNADANHIDNDDIRSFDRNLHWTVMANSCSSREDSCQLVQISAIPVGSSLPRYYMTSFVKLPQDCNVMSIKFYSDDGNSTLTSESSPSYEEGRQGIGLLLRRSRDEGNADEELWLFEYDELPFLDVQHTFDCNERLVIRKYNEKLDETSFLTSNEEEEEEENGVNAVNSKWRCVRTIAPLTSAPTPSQTSIEVSGSRGIGAVSCGRTNTIDIFDLEEDEDDESDDEESSSDEN
uniref:Anaphase-promoting complex subunit 4 n=1 Tax=Chaetoceros debilis TaxID=122233 RepID=A0A7S3Q2N8_9STRA